MMSSNVNELELDQVIRITNLFNEEIKEPVIIENFDQKAEIIENDNLKILRDIQDILQNCSILTEKQKLDYCKSQRFFMKLYLKEVNRR